MAENAPGLPPAPDTTVGHDRHECPKRLMDEQYFPAQYKSDRWIRIAWHESQSIVPRLPRICSYCGSLNPSDGIELIVKYDWTTFLGRNGSFEHVYFVPSIPEYENQIIDDTLAVLHAWHLDDDFRLLLSDALIDQALRRLGE